MEDGGYDHIAFEQRAMLLKFHIIVSIASVYVVWAIMERRTSGVDPSLTTIVRRRADSNCLPLTPNASASVIDCVG